MSTTSAVALESPCAAYEAATVVVVSKDRLLWSCVRRSAVTSFRVALGAGGMGKSTEGDRRTPLGEYRLGAPKTSRAFGLFIPIGYPTRVQRSKGYSGSGVGIHGPPSTELDPLTAVSNWTDGCIALDSRSDIERLSQWVTSERVQAIHIE